MKVIGLTGNIGCGKSTVAGMLREEGVATIDADAVAREIRHNDADARAEIQRRFGTYEADELARIVFSDAGALRDLERILHPRVRGAVRARLAELAEGGIDDGQRRGDQAARVAARRRVRRDLGRALRRGRRHPPPGRVTRDGRGDGAEPAREPVLAGGQGRRRRRRDRRVGADGGDAPPGGASPGGAPRDAGT